MSDFEPAMDKKSKPSKPAAGGCWTSTGGGNSIAFKRPGLNLMAVHRILGASGIDLTGGQRKEAAHPYNAPNAT